MPASKSLPDIVRDVYVLLEPLDSPNRKRVVDSALNLLGEDVGVGSRAPKGAQKNFDSEGQGGGFGAKADRWMTQNGVSMAAIEEVFHCEGSEIQVIASQVPGSSKRAQTHACYLICGIRAMLATDEPKFTDAEATDLCKHIGCFDAANHAKSRAELGNIVAGTKSAGYTLPAPGLRAAATLLKAMATTS